MKFLKKRKFNYVIYQRFHDAHIPIEFSVLPYCIKSVPTSWIRLSNVCKQLYSFITFTFMDIVSVSSVFTKLFRRYMKNWYCEWLGDLLPFCYIFRVCQVSTKVNVLGGHLSEKMIFTTSFCRNNHHLPYCKSKHSILWMTDRCPDQLYSSNK